MKNNSKMVEFLAIKDAGKESKRREIQQDILLKEILAV